MSLPICREDGCENLGVFTLVDEDGVSTSLCYEHYIPLQTFTLFPDTVDETPVFHADVETGGYCRLPKGHEGFCSPTLERKP